MERQQDSSEYLLRRMEIVCRREKREARQMQRVMMRMRGEVTKVVTIVVVKRKYQKQTKLDGEGAGGGGRRVGGLGPYMLYVGMSVQKVEMIVALG